MQQLLRSKFDPIRAYRSHEGTILAADVVPAGFGAPFDHAYGYLVKGGAMAGHVHKTDEIYIVLSGSGYVILDGKNRLVRAGDTVVIPAGMWHTMLCTNQNEEPFLWAALWWEPVRPTVPTQEILIQHFEKEKAQSAHGGTILADRVVPVEMETPFGHAYGYLQGNGAMEEHSHNSQELYIVYSGAGAITVDGLREAVGPGDVIAIPPNAMHTIEAESEAHLLWAALWWEKEHNVIF